MRELSREQIVRFTQVDYDREMAFVAVREHTGETVGVARLVREGAAGSRPHRQPAWPAVFNR